MCPSVVVVKSYVSEGASSAASPHRSSHSWHIPLEWVSLHGPAYAAAHGRHHVCRSTRVAATTSSATRHVHCMTLLHLARVVLGMSGLLLLLLLLSVGNTARVLLGLFRTTCTAPHDNDSLTVLFSCSIPRSWVENYRRPSKVVNERVVYLIPLPSDTKLAVRRFSSWTGGYLLEISAAALLVCCVLDSPIGHGLILLNVGRESIMGDVCACENVQNGEGARL